MISVIHSKIQSRVIRFMKRLSRSYPMSITHNMTSSIYGWHVVDPNGDTEVDELHVVTVYDNCIEHIIDTIGDVQNRRCEIYPYSKYSIRYIENSLLASISTIREYVFRYDEEIETY